MVRAACATKGWIAPEWPIEYGGGGLSDRQSRVIRQEMKRINAARHCTA